jgi:pyruvate,orthophosphate dikinase
MKWADQIRRLEVWANADTPQDAQRGRDFGAQGIGLCRTEHMFFGEERIGIMRQMILSAGSYAILRDEIAALKSREELTKQQKEHLSKLKQQFKQPKQNFENALKKLLPYQRRDFVNLFKAMAGQPVTIRLLDPPLHEFLPQEAKAQRELSRRLQIKPSEVKARVKELHEFNPMLGHRGVRLGVTHPEIYRMQARAIMEAAFAAAKKSKKRIKPEIMLPLVGTSEEAEFIKQEIIDEINQVFKRRKSKLKYLIGTMIEIPRAAIIAERIAKELDFFSFGTNDLTQMTLGLSRDDAGKFLPAYVKRGLYPKDPFESLDLEGCGALVEMGIQRGRQGNPKLVVGICGEHGGDPDSIKFCHRVGMNYVSCSPFRVPTARLAAAHAALNQNNSA